MAKKRVEKSNVEIDIGGIGGSMQGVIAGGDVRDVTITIGGQPTAADKQPSLAEFRQLLADIQQDMAEIVQQQDLLAKVDPAAPFTAQGAEQSVKSAAEQVEPEMEAEEAESVQKRLTTGLNLFAGILDGAKTVAKKTDEVGEAIIPIVQRLEPLVQKLGVAALWTARLWLAN